MQNEVSVAISADSESVGMGRSVTVSVEVARDDGQQVGEQLLLPYVNGRRWGAHTFTDEDGRAQIMLPLPRPGEAKIQVQALPAPRAAWIWSADTRDEQTIYLQHSFSVEQQPESASLWVAVDDSATVWLNGRRVTEQGGWTAVERIALAVEGFVTGENTLSVEARNGGGPAGFIARLVLDAPGGPRCVCSSSEWRVFPVRPSAWPGKAAEAEEGERPKTIGDLFTSPWGAAMNHWPAGCSRQMLIAGRRAPEGANMSNAVEVAVNYRHLKPIDTPADRRVGMQWEPWFTPHANNWQTGQAVPLVGFYRSYNRDVIRQHIMWLVESGVDFLVVDWTNHLWGCEHWNERPEHTNEIIHATTLTLETLACMRDEGLPYPQLVLYPGLNNGPKTTMTAVNEELEWIYHNYVRNPRFEDLFVEYLGKPLVLIHNGAGPKAVEEATEPVNDEHFTVRWQSSQHQITRHNEEGYWSWMDGVLDLPVTRYQAEAEALTVPIAFFGPGGWLAEDAYGRRNGWTFVEAFKSALEHRPRFMEIHQFNEFAGQPEGHGYGPDNDIYVDSYSPEFSDDIEPTSLTTPAYRGDGGWGFYYLNLTRALVDLYSQQEPQTTVVVVGRPNLREVVGGDELTVSWTWVGREPASFAIAIDGVEVATGLQGTETTIDVSGLPDGRKTLRLTAEGTESRYKLSYTHDSLPLDEPVAAYCEVPFVLRGGE